MMTTKKSLESALPKRSVAMSKCSSRYWIVAYLAMFLLVVGLPKTTAIIPPDFSSDYHYNCTSLSPLAKQKLGVCNDDESPNLNTPAAIKGKSFDEIVAEQRKKLNLPIVNTYHPVALGDSDCLFLDDEECQEMDDEFNKRMIHSKSVVREKSNLNKKLSSSAASSSRTQASTTTEQTTMNVLVVLVQWEDHTSDIKTLPPREHYDAIFNGNNVASSGLTDEEYKDMVKTNSIHHYLDINSHGNFNAKFHIQDWTMTNGTEAYYADGTMGLPKAFRSGKPQLRQAFAYVLESLEKEGNIDFTLFDEDDDGKMDNVMFCRVAFILLLICMPRLAQRWSIQACFLAIWLSCKMR